jgi:hypothetical protein
MAKVDIIGNVSHNGVKEPPYQRKDRSELKRSLLCHVVMFCWLCVFLFGSYYGFAITPRSAQNKELRKSLDTIVYYELNEGGHLVKTDRPLKKIVEKP